MFLEKICLWMGQILHIGNANINVRNGVSAHFTTFSTITDAIGLHTTPLSCCPSSVFKATWRCLLWASHTEQQQCWSDGMTGFSLVSLWSCCVHSYSCALSLSDCILHGSTQASRQADIAQVWFQQHRLNKIFLFSSVVCLFISSNSGLFFSDLLLHTWQLLSPWLTGANVSSYCGINSYHLSSRLS